ncbi:hypothetical protein B0H21DRAFT_714426 [Amylocystis lapponica]|nr:hypothetical protein B0H21DRAFT_714426 [Amylocystis lapponica]
MPSSSLPEGISGKSLSFFGPDGLGSLGDSAEKMLTGESSTRHMAKTRLTGAEGLGEGDISSDDELVNLDGVDDNGEPTDFAGHVLTNNPLITPGLEKGKRKASALTTEHGSDTDIEDNNGASGGRPAGIVNAQANSRPNTELTANGLLHFRRGEADTTSSLKSSSLANILSLKQPIFTQTSESTSGFFQQLNSPHPQLTYILANGFHLPLTLCTSQAIKSMNAKPETLKMQKMHDRNGAKREILDVSAWPNKELLQTEDWRDTWGNFKVILALVCDSIVCARFANHMQWLCDLPDFKESSRRYSTLT